MKSLLFLFGRTPLLSRAEILRLIEVGLFPASVSREFSDGLIVSTEAIPNSTFFDRLGGTIRVVDLADSLEEMLPEHLDGKFSFGVSYFHISDWRARRRNHNAEIKQKLRHRQISARFLDASGAELPSAAVLGNRLIERGAEFVVYAVGQDELVGRTVFLQNIDSYTARDQARPARYPKVGMLPPKLAQMMINLAVSDSTEVIWDPLAGTGVVLQEALRMGYTSVGSDNSPEMVDASKENIEWFRAQVSGRPEADIFLADIKDGWPPHLKSVDAIVTEGYLGEPLSRFPSKSYIQELQTQLYDLYRSFFQEAADHLATGSRIVLALPYFFEGNDFQRMNFVDDLASDQYNLQGIYDYRPHQQIVGRQITIFEKD